MRVTAEVWAEINQLIANFAWGIDRGDPGLAAAQFTVTGRLIVPSSLEPGARNDIFEGRDAIRKRWEGRTNVVTRHAFLNLSLIQTTADRIDGKMLLFGYRHEGEGMGAPIPAVISDFDDIIVRDTDGCWRFAERKATVIFARKAGP